LIALATSAGKHFGKEFSCLISFELGEDGIGIEEEISGVASKRAARLYII
jgi:hypothetical protein